MRSGHYRQRITLQSRQETRDAFGAPVLAWVDAFPAMTAAGGIPAAVLTGPGRELRAAGGPQEEIAARIAFRYLTGVTQTMRVLWDGQLYNIRSIELDRTAQREVRLLCTTGVNDGA